MRAEQAATFSQTVENLPPVQTISVVSGKGGDGRTAVALNLAIAMSRLRSRVLLMDANLALGNIDLALNVKQQFNLSHLIKGSKTLQDIVVTGPEGVSIVPSAHGDAEMSQLSQVEHIGIVNAFSSLPVAADIMFIDNDAGVSRSVLDFTHAARQVLVVVCDEPASLQNAFLTIKAISANRGTDRFRVIANKVSSSQHGLDVYSELFRMTDRYLDVLLEYCGSIPQDDMMLQANQERTSVLEAHPGCKSARSVERLANKIKEWPKPLEPKGQSEFFVERLVNPSFNDR